MQKKTGIRQVLMGYGLGMEWHYMGLCAVKKRSKSHIPFYVLNLLFQLSHILIPIIILIILTFLVQNFSLFSIFILP